MGYIEHSTYVSCDMFHTVDADGFYTTTQNNEVINFVASGQAYTLNTIRVFAGDVPLAIKFNNYLGTFRVSANSSDGLDKLKITSIQVLCPLGTKIRYDGLNY